MDNKIKIIGILFILGLIVIGFASTLEYKKGINIYYDLAQITEQRQVEFNNYEGKITTNYKVNGNLFIESDKRIESYNLQNALNGITAIIYDRLGNRYEGQLIDNNRLLTEEGIVDITAPTSIIYQTKYLSNLLDIIFEEEKGSANIVLNYLTQDINWKPILRINKEDKLELELYGKVNNKGEAYSGAIDLITQRIGQGFYIEKNFMLEAANPVPRATENSIGDRYSFHIDNIKLLKGENYIPLEKQTTEYSTYYRAEVLGNKVEKYLTFKSPIIIPANTVIEYYDKGTYLIETNNYEDISKDEIAKIKIEDAYDIDLDSKIIEESGDYYRGQKIYLANITNYKDEPIEIRLYFHPYADYWEINKDYKKEDSRAIYWVINVPAKENVEFTFTYKYENER